MKLENLIKEAEQLTLSDILNGRTYLKSKGYTNFSISNEDYDILIQLATDVIGGHSKTRQRVKSVLRNPIGVQHWALSRIFIRMNDNGIRVSYCAGQCYASELQTLRDYLKK